jgi:formate--tetrahydrofolate ligase
MSFPSDLEIARAGKPVPLVDIAAQMGISEDYLEPYGKSLAKISLEAIESLKDRPKAKYVVVTAITPTPLGEGKTTTTVGLGMAMKHIGKKSVISLRQPSMGPTFGIKGGAAGGGYSQVIPMEQLNLHLTGDFHAVTAAHNLLSAMVDNHLHQGNELGLDMNNITWRRVLDVNDRSLRNLVVGMGTAMDGVVRQTGFDITAASEVMAVLALATSLKDLRSRLGRIVVGYTKAGVPVTAEQLKGAGSMAESQTCCKRWRTRLSSCTPVRLATLRTVTLQSLVTSSAFAVATI